MEKYERKVYAYLYYKVHTPQDAEDLTTKTFLRFIKHAKNLKNAKILPYLLRIAHNLACDFYRGMRSTVRLLPNIGSRRNPVEEVEKKELMESLKEKLQRLSPRDREVFLLYYFEKLSIKEISETMGLTESNVKIILHRSRKKIKKELEEEWGGGNNEGD